MNRLDKIKEPLKQDFLKYEEFMRDALMNDNAYVADIMDYIVSNRGKGVRPMLVFIMAGLHAVAESDPSRKYLAAMLVEMIHTASLVHDDVVDNADTRHGRESVNKRWSPRISILSGDYILARGFAMGILSGHMDIITYVIAKVSDLAEGELIQSDANDRGEMDRETYLEIIYKKTATLLGVSCGAGAMAAGADSDEVDIAGKIGQNLGMAFQIKDDILDYYPEHQTGKPFCADLKEKKITLPLLSILERSDELTRRLILSKFDCFDTEPEKVNEVREFVLKEGGIAAAEEVMNEYLGHAREMIADYPASAFKNSLLELCEYIGERDK